MMQSIINLLISIVTLTKVVECLLTPPDNIGHSLGHHATRRQTLALGSSFSPLSVAESESPRTLIRKGMQSFREGDVSSSLSFFDRADDVVTDGSLRPYLWQRGISYYYLDRFMEGSKQFRLDVSVNPMSLLVVLLQVDLVSLYRIGKFVGRRGNCCKPLKLDLMQVDLNVHNQKHVTVGYSLFNTFGSKRFPSV
eukprot:CCRYP_012896-RF/>CCRYP_012896-RF protein AED:0.39 eAED:0.39 QI:76/0.33/0.25/1/0/0/4/0/194